MTKDSFKIEVTHDGAQLCSKEFPIGPDNGDVFIVVPSSVLGRPGKDHRFMTERGWNSEMTSNEL